MSTGFDDFDGVPQAPPGDGSGRRGKVALAFALMVGVLVVVAFWGKGREAPQLSPTLEHMASAQGRDVNACLACHRFDSSARPRPAGHTPRHDCWGCHVIRTGPDPS